MHIVVAGSPAAKKTCDFSLRWQLSPDETERRQTDCDVGETAPHERGDSILVKTKGFIKHSSNTQNKTGAKDVGNSTSSAPAP